MAYAVTMLEFNKEMVAANNNLFWERAEDMSTPRTAFKIHRNHPRSEVAGDSGRTPTSCCCTPSRTAAAWLYEASGDEEYLRYVSQNAAGSAGPCSSSPGTSSTDGPG
ncbi:unnamed protein product [Urochloa humidicola]